MHECLRRLAGWGTQANTSCWMAFGGCKLFTVPQTTTTACGLPDDSSILECSSLLLGCQHVPYVRPIWLTLQAVSYPDQQQAARPRCCTWANADTVPPKILQLQMLRHTSPDLCESAVCRAAGEGRRQVAQHQTPGSGTSQAACQHGPTGA